MNTHEELDSGSSSVGRWRMRFGLGSALLLTAVCCGFLGIWSYYIQPYRSTSILTERITELAGTYRANPSDGPEWQRRMVAYLLEEDAFVDVVEIDVSAKPITEGDLRLIAQMRKLQRLVVDRTECGDAVAVLLSQLSDLRMLSARYTDVTDRGASALVQSESLQQLFLTGCDISAPTLEAVPTDSSLELFVRFTKVDEPSVASCLRRAANCQVHSYVGG